MRDRIANESPRKDYKLIRNCGWIDRQHGELFEARAMNFLVTFTGRVCCFSPVTFQMLRCSPEIGCELEPDRVGVTPRLKCFQMRMKEEPDKEAESQACPNLLPLPSKCQNY